ncbi:MAG: hypothetical protein AB8E82_18285 [Aureispira sp.]
MYRIIGLLALACCLGLAACQERPEGCTDPRAINFDPEADVLSDVGCTYYQLEIAWQHYSQNAPNDTLKMGNWLLDNAGEFFFLERCNWLGSGVRLQAVGNNTASASPDNILLYKNDGTATEVEDNFFLMALDNFQTEAVGWPELGDFDQLYFQVGIDANLQAVNPSRTPTQAHPLSATAVPYLYDSTQTAFSSLELVAIQPNNNNHRIEIRLADVFNFAFPYVVQVVDGENVPIRIRLNYDVLFAGVSFSNDSVTMIENKLRQNIPLAFSVY